MTRLQWTEQSARAAAEWWWGHIQAGVFDNGAPNTVVDTVAAMLHEVARPEEGKRAQFIETTVATLLAEQPRELYCDYEPWWVLAGIAKACDLPVFGVFPWKSRTALRDDGIYAKCGYGIAEERIWPPLAVAA